MSVKKIIIANWKMKVSYKKASALLKKFRALKFSAAAEAVLCPDFITLPLTASSLKGSQLKLGAQDAAPAARGAYTGEVAATDLRDLGVKYVILGHSERREYLAESDQLINQKLQTVLAVKGLTPVLCVGEKKRGKNPKAILFKQLEGALRNIKLTSAQSIVVAYEPVWAIGTGQVVSPQEVILAHLLIKGWLTKRFSAQQCRVIYGGSVDAKNSANFRDISVVDGLLVGGASLNPKDFLTIFTSVLK
jgi:triosephosphate isomerase